MRDVEGRSAQDWIGERVADAKDAILGGTGGGAWTPAQGGQTTATEAWWTDLHFDQAGRLVPWKDNEWSARELAVSDAAYAAIARDYLAPFKNVAADLNNWACASIYADPGDAATAGEGLAAFKHKSELIEGNLSLIREHTK